MVLARDDRVAALFLCVSAAVIHKCLVLGTSVVSLETMCGAVFSFTKKVQIFAFLKVRGLVRCRREASLCFHLSIDSRPFQPKNKMMKTQLFFFGGRAVGSRSSTIDVLLRCADQTCPSQLVE